MCAACGCAVLGRPSGWRDGNRRPRRIGARRRAGRGRSRALLLREQLDPQARRLDGTAFDGADMASHPIRVVSAKTGAITTLVGEPTSADIVDGPKIKARLYSPDSLAFDSASHTLFTDGQTVRAVDTQTTLVTTIAGSISQSDYVDGPKEVARFDRPSGLAF